MNSKLATLLATALCSVVLVVSTMAQTFGTPGLGGGQAGQNLYLTGQGAFAKQPGNELFKGPRMGRMPGMSAEDAELVQHVAGLVAKLGEAKSDTDKDTIKTQLNDALAKQFDQRQKRHELEIAELEAKVKKLKDLVARRQENRRDIIAKRLDQILRDSEGLGW
jgi:hypothetical protein